uniref:Uncharacterized protein n=1 Tax=Branchiostoma floridae TaxID=7739 RepID=C3ZD71_BRAFL|eukprot:XP_002593571.1 hypothetical protein BRAFLDRAFT_88482 [Branchiostoma floridae]
MILPKTRVAGRGPIDWSWPAGGAELRISVLEPSSQDQLHEAIQAMSGRAKGKVGRGAMSRRAKGKQCLDVPRERWAGEVPGVTVTEALHSIRRQWSWRKGRRLGASSRSMSGRAKGKVGRGGARRQSQRRFTASGDSGPGGKEGVLVPPLVQCLDVPRERWAGEVSGVTVTEALHSIRRAVVLAERKASWCLLSLWVSLEVFISFFRRHSMTFRCLDGHRTFPRHLISNVWTCQGKGGQGRCQASQSQRRFTTSGETVVLAERKASWCLLSLWVSLEVFICYFRRNSMTQCLDVPRERWAEEVPVTTSTKALHNIRRDSGPGGKEGVLVPPLVQCLDVPRERWAGEVPVATSTKALHSIRDSGPGGKEGVLVPPLVVAMSGRAKGKVGRGGASRYIHEGASQHTDSGPGGKEGVLVPPLVVAMSGRAKGKVGRGGASRYIHEGASQHTDSGPGGKEGVLVPPLVVAMSGRAKGKVGRGGASRYIHKGASQHTDSGPGGKEGVLVPPLVDPVVNVARGKPVTANVTCGSPAEDFYPHSDSVKPPPDRQLQICDASDPVLAHNASLMTDGNSSTWWQSTSLRQLMSAGNGLGNQAEVYITLDLGATYHPENITIHMGDTKRPGRLAIMRSNDGMNFDPWLYLVTNGNRDCRRFGVAMQPEPDGSPESVVCREYAQLGVEQLYNERITVSLSEVPPSFSDEALLMWQAVRHLQLSFYDMDLVLGIFEDQFHHYAVSEVSVMAGCECNGLGIGCEISADSGQYECICSGNTQGPFCEECQPLYNQFPYQPGQPCQACNCNNHSQVCVYNETVAAGNLSMSANGSFHGGGVCLSCRDNTTGTNCEQCDTLFYRNPEVSHQSSSACLPCECDLVGSSSSQCNMETGQCPCKPGVGGRMCDVCLPGYYNFSSGGCTPCPCYPLLHHTPCYVDQGGQVTCNCTQGHKGEQCERCEDFYWGDPVHGTACAECDCSGNSDQCSNVTGECIGCHGNTTGFNCDRCADGFFGDAVFGNCSACACDEAGSVALVCNHTTGLCPCKPGVDSSTRRCSRCMENHYGFDTPDGDGTDSQPGCSPCNCDVLGSTSLQCGEGGNCSCHPGVEGTKCDVCMEGTYGLPDMECLACDCDPVGTLSDFDPFLPTTTQSAVGQTTILGLTTTQDITTQGALIGSTPIQGITDDTTLQAETTAIVTTEATTNVTSSATSQGPETPSVTTVQAETTDTTTTVDTTNVTSSATSQGPETPGVTTGQTETTDTTTNITSSATSQGPETPSVTTGQTETTDTTTNITSSATSQGPETPSVTTVLAETTTTTVLLQMIHHLLHLKALKLLV